MQLLEEWQLVGLCRMHLPEMETKGVARARLERALGRQQHGDAGAVGRGPQGRSAGFVWTEAREARLLALHGELVEAKRVAEEKASSALQGQLGARGVRALQQQHAARGSVWPALSAVLARECGERTTASQCRKRWVALRRLE